jgi:hypothetical protein
MSRQRWCAPSPLVEEGWGEGSTRAVPMRPPPSLTLPHKGGGNRSSADALAMTVRKTATSHTVVIPRACGISSTPRLFDSITGVSGILDHPQEPVIGLAEGETRWRVMTTGGGWGAIFKQPRPSLRANGSRECAPDDRLREAIHASRRKDGLLRRVRSSQ